MPNPRPIKFRVWDTFTKKMVATGFHVIGETTVFGQIDQYASESLNPEHVDEQGHHHTLPRYNDFVLMQFTGLKDADGTEIYEGDVVVCDGTPEEVRIGLFTLEDRGNTWNMYGSHTHSEDFGENPLEKPCSLRVIGNIYENPEMLDVKSEHLDPNSPPPAR